MQVNLLKNTMRVEFDSQAISAKQIEQAVSNIGYGAQVAQSLWQTKVNQERITPEQEGLDQERQEAQSKSVPESVLKSELRLKLEQKSKISGQAATNEQNGLDKDSKQDRQPQDKLTPNSTYANNNRTHTDATLESSSLLTEQEQALSTQRHKLYASIALTLPLFYLSMGKMWDWPLPAFLDGFAHIFDQALLQMLLALAVIYLNRHYFINGFKALYRKAPNMDSLIAIGAGAATLFSLLTTYQIAAYSNAVLAECLELINGHVLDHIPDGQAIHKLAHNLYFESAAMILTLISLGKYFEARAKGKTSQALSKLMALVPQKATVLKNGQEIPVPIAQVAINDLVVVKAGEQVPVDGVIIEGYGLLDESALTGESIPLDKGVGSKVTGATINTDGRFVMRTERIGADTTLAQIIQIVDEATSSSAPIARIADKISGIFVPVVIGIAALTLVVWLMCGASLAFALTCSIAVLVISCPCALGLATPTAIMVGTGQAAQHGILFKSASVMERMGEVDTVVLDKTGTLTTGKMQLKAVISLVPQESEYEAKAAERKAAGAVSTSLETHTAHAQKSALTLLFKVAALEQYSAHPLAKAIVKASHELKAQLEQTEYSEQEDSNETNERLVSKESKALDKEHDKIQRNFTLPEITNFTNLTGQGLIGYLSGQQLAVGNLKLLEHLKVQELPSAVTAKVQELSSQGHTILYVVQERSVIGLLALADSLKETSAQAVALLKELPVEILLLTGDQNQTAQHIGKQAGITEVISQVLPQDKAQVIKNLQSQGKKVAMVGDGINDAPALAQADVGIAIGAGSDIALEAADVVLVKSQLTDVVAAMQLSRAVVRNIKENLFWAFIYNAIGIPIAAGVFFSLLGLSLSPMIAAAAMSCSSVSVVSNALRLRRFKPQLQLKSQSKAQIQDPNKDQNSQVTAPAPDRSTSLDLAYSTTIALALWSVLPNTRKQAMTSKCLTIEGMSCPHCVKAVTKALQSVEGVSDVHVDLASKQATLQASEAVTDDMLKQAIADADFTVVAIS